MTSGNQLIFLERLGFKICDYLYEPIPNLYNIQILSLIVALSTIDNKDMDRTYRSYQRYLRGPVETKQVYLYRVSIIIIKTPQLPSPPGTRPQIYLT